MKETLEQPSSDLNSRIMALLLKNAPEKRVFRIGKTVSPGLIFGVFVVYMFIIAGGMLLLRGNTGAVSELMVVLKDLFPVLLTIGGGISFFILFAQLDEWLKQHDRKTSIK